jgi:GTP cyclohydrolase II
MFTYLDPSVRSRLIEQHKLVRFNARGETIAPNDSPPPGELSLSMLGPIPLPIRLGELELELSWYAFVRHTELAKADELASELRQRNASRLFPTLVTSMAVNSVLLHGNPLAHENPLVRVHSSCMTGDVFGSLRCECGPQLGSALERIAQEPTGGMLVYMAGHEGRGIGLWAKAATYLLQDAGENTYQANRSLGLPDDSRDFSDAAAVLRHFLNDRPFRLLTNNPKKVSDLTRHGISHITPVKHVVGVGRWNRRYLAAKRDWGHQLDDGDIDTPR